MLQWCIKIFFKYLIIKKCDNLRKVMHYLLYPYLYVLKKLREENYFFFHIVWKRIIVNWHDSNAGLFQCWAVNWYSNSFQDTQFTSLRYIQHAKICAASKKWELWERLWQRSQDSSRECGIHVPKSFGFPAENLLCSTQLTADTVTKLLKN